MKISRSKPRRNANAIQLIQKLKAVEMKAEKSYKECNKKRPKTKKEKVIEERTGEQNNFLSFLKNEKNTQQQQQQQL